jgi:hypothetical protein
MRTVFRISVPPQRCTYSADFKKRILLSYGIPDMVMSHSVLVTMADSDVHVTRFTVCMFRKFSTKPCVTPFSLSYFETHCRD